MTAATSRVIFFVPVPNPQKGVTGAVVGSQTVLEAVRTHFDVEVVPMQHSAIRNSEAPIRPGILWRLLADHRQSVRELRTELRREPNRPLTLYMVANSSVAASLRDLASLMVAVATRPDIRIILHTRNGNFFFPESALARIIRRRVLERADRVICLSRRLLPDAAQLEALLPGLSNKIRVVPNTIDDKLVPAPAKIAASHHRKGPIRVLYLSNFIPSKGYKILGEAARLLAGRGMSDRFRFVFRGKWLDEGQREAFAASFSPELIATGFVDIGGPLWERSEVQEEMLSSDVFCLPTSYPAEAMPRSIIEAMACRCAIIANDHASIADLVKDGQNGLLKRGIAASDIADFLENSDRNRLSAMGDTSLAQFEKAFAREIHDRNVIELFQ